MNQVAIFGPVLAMLLLTMIVWVYMFAKRIPWIQSVNPTPEQMRPGEFEKIQPEDVLNPSSNFKNLFEIPILFYVLAFLLFVTERVDTIYMVAAWLFVLTRYAHSFVHCTFNHVMTRFMLYLVGVVIVVFIGLRAAYQIGM